MAEMNLSERALQFLGINSIARDGDEELVNYLIPLYEALGAKVILQQVFHSVEDHGKRQFNLIGILGDDLVDVRTQRGLLMMSHVDTPSPGNLSDWHRLNSKPWVPQIDGNEAIGLGAADAKLDFLCKLEACKNFVGKTLAQPLYLIASCGAESPIMGAKYLIQSKVVNPKYVLVGAPTELAIVNSHKSKLVVGLQISFVSVDKDTQEFNTRIRIATKGKSAHAAHPEHGDSAVDKITSLLRFLRTNQISMKLFSIAGGSDMNKIPDTAEVSIVIPDLQLDAFRRKFKQYLIDHPKDFFELKFGGTGSEGVRLFPEELVDALFQMDDLVKSVSAKLRVAQNPEFAPPHSTVAINSIVHELDVITLYLHLALLPEVSGPEQRREVESGIQMELDRISQSYRRLSFRYKRVLAAPPMYTDESSTFVKTLLGALNRSGIPTKTASGSACTEGSFFSDRGIAAVAFGPGTGPGNSHSADERNDLMQMEAAVRFYTQAIDSFCVRGI